MTGVTARAGTATTAAAAATTTGVAAAATTTGVAAGARTTAATLLQLSCNNGIHSGSVVEVATGTHSSSSDHNTKMPITAVMMRRFIPK